ncbi:MAG: hypothetical protein LH630_03950, partial [Actinomycetia bacterium]|nr:hypothetical protein [Actinomycetes bacterium]
YVLTQDYALVVVKAASKNVDPYTNTLFENASAGETVWADTNGNFTFDPGGKGGDKAISHIIVCDGEESSSPPVSSSAPASSSEEPSPSESESTDEPSPSESESTDEPSPSESESTGSASPSESESTGSAPSNGSPEATEIESSGAAALPKTGPGAPVAGAIGISLLLIGVGVLLLLGPGRLIPATYHRKH